MLIAQLSDPHVTTGPLAGEQASGLHRALGRVLALRPRPDCVVITGDLVSNGRPDEYVALREIIGRFPLPVHLAAGNHDDRESLLDTFGGTPYLGGGFSAYYRVDHADGTVVVLDSLAPGDSGGRLGEEQLAWLDGALANRPEVPAVVCLHHPPVAVGIPAADAIRLADGDALAEVIGRHPHVVRVTAGHLHRSVTTAFAGTVLTTAPSTWVQSTLTMTDDEEIGLVAEPTAFLLHRVTADGCVTHTVQASHAAGQTCWF
ncbi:phosphodiesterase [Micromonospora globispora]|uniref:Phosphodiesterase n=1 Tax=Micromonospora globispora TaxID=1450148 RepID=A0A317JWN3_9ACTN|nr:phosphodiesterase [Micromonospora globispora]PWU45171.1 phosphodiesterase [Micromonospora globispora]PWU61173.1 phosphodiesterase [Micromonospora globispora]RQW92429.1 phosphodiesterase [Micromonospora globispora]